MIKPEKMRTFVTDITDAKMLCKVVSTNGKVGFESNTEL